MTKDFGQEFIQNLDDYFNHDLVPPVIRKVAIQDELVERMQDAKINKWYRDSIKALCLHDSNLQNNILTGDYSLPYVLFVSDDELKEIIPSDNRHFDRSKETLKKNLERLNVTICSAPKNYP